jgi:hypothetical protein
LGTSALITSFSLVSSIDGFCGGNIYFYKNAGASGTTLANVGASFSVEGPLDSFISTVQSCDSVFAITLLADLEATRFNPSGVSMTYVCKNNEMYLCKFT